MIQNAWKYCIELPAVDKSDFEHMLHMNYNYNLVDFAPLVFYCTYAKLPNNLILILPSFYHFLSLKSGEFPAKGKNSATHNIMIAIMSSLFYCLRKSLRL